MRYSPPGYIEIRFRPSYLEIANPEIYTNYCLADQALTSSREGSVYIKKTIAGIELRKTLKRLSMLKDDWDSYGSSRPSDASIKKANQLANAFIEFGLLPDAITPSAEGGVAICFLRSHRYADVECLNSGEIVAVRYGANENPQAWKIESDSDALDESVKGLSQYLSA